MSTLKTDAISAATGTNTNLALTGKGTGKVAIGDAALLFPDADGSSSGDVLQTNASGVLSFATPAAGGSWNIIGTAEADDSASLTVTGLDSTYDMYAVGISNLHPASTAIPWIRFGDSSGIKSDAEYDWWVGSWNATAEVRNGTNASKIEIMHQDGVGGATGAGYAAMLWIGQSGDTTIQNQIGGTFSGENNGLARYTGLCGGIYQASTTPIVLDRVQLLMATGNITAGRLTVWGLAHA